MIRLLTCFLLGVACSALPAAAQAPASYRVPAEQVAPLPPPSPKTLSRCYAVAELQAPIYRDLHKLDEMTCIFGPVGPIAMLDDGFFALERGTGLPITHQDGTFYISMGAYASTSRFYVLKSDVELRGPCDALPHLAPVEALRGMASLRRTGTPLD